MRGEARAYEGGELQGDGSRRGAHVQRGPGGRRDAGTREGAAQGTSQGAPQGVAQGAREGAPQAMREGAAQGAREGAGQAPRGQRSARVRGVITRWRTRGVVACAAIMALGAFVGLLFFARPEVSNVEMRTLTAFPEFSFESFKDGSFFTDVSLWYADTYPLREPMVAADHAIDGLFGVSAGGGMVGGNVAADEIPADAGEGAQGEGAEGGGSQGGEQSEAARPLVEPPDEQVMAADIQDNIMEGVYVQDGAAYSIYYFDQYAADVYVQAMNTAAENLDGQATVYSIMSPANSITLPDEDAAKLGGSDQQQTLAYLASRYDSRVRQVEIVADIIAHRDEYLYFNTDHHWTQLGAYYAYTAFCKEAGIQAHSLSSWRRLEFDGFEGTYYDIVTSFGEARGDYVEAYVPNGTNTLTYWPDGDGGDELEGFVVDESAGEWDAPLKYSCFIQGDQPLEVIENPSITDGSSCLVVKDSYGDAFAPLLVDSYQTVHVIDFRYTDKNICDYARENNIGTVVFLTGMKIGLTQTVAETLLTEVS